MASFYTYLIASLPMLHFGMKPPFSREIFLGICEKLIPKDDLEILRAASISGEDIQKHAEPPVLKKWRVFDAALRNDLVRLRAARKRLDAHRYLRQDDYADSFITHIAAQASRNPSILDAEIMLDQERWRFLDGLESGHFFDLDFLAVYSHKLLILERWDRINALDKSRALEEALK
ncbi:MAG: hypothetical protein V2A64_01260 [Candidatus Omnitrophota bacterium]